MYLIQDSKDLLYVVLAFCILWLTIFIAWFIYYLAMMMRQFYVIIKNVREKVKKVDETIDIIKDKIEHSASYLSLIGDGVKKIVEVAKEYSGKKGGGAKTKSSRK